MHEQLYLMPPYAEKKFVFGQQIFLKSSSRFLMTPNETVFTFCILRFATSILALRPLWTEKQRYCDGDSGDMMLTGSIGSV